MSDQTQFARLKKYLELDPQNRRLALDAARSGLAVGEANAVVEMLRAALLHAPADAALQFELGVAMLAAGTYEDAARQFSDLMSSADGSHPAVCYNCAYAHFQLGEYEETLQILAPLSEAEANGIPEVFQLRGRAKHRLDQISEAVSDFRRYTQLCPSDPMAWGEQALAEFDAGESSSAKQSAEHSLALDPHNAYAHLTLGGIALEQQEASQAIDHFSDVVRMSPQNGRAWSGLAFARMLELDTDRARVSFEKAVQYMPDHIGTWHGLAWLLLIENDLEGAHAALQNALEIDRNFGETHGSLAVVAVLQGREVEAEKMIRRGLGLDPQSFSARYAKTLILSRRGEAEKAGQGVAAIMQSASPAGGARSIQETVSDYLKKMQRPPQGSSGEKWH